MRVICGCAEVAQLDGGAQTCFEDGLCHLAPLVPPVGDDGDDVSLPHLQTGYREAALAGSKTLLNRLTAK